MNTPIDMSQLELFSVSSLHTFYGSSLAILVIVELIKNLPIISKIPTKWLAVAVGELLFLLLMPSIPHTIAEWVTLVLNGLLSASAAIGGWHCISTLKKGD